MSDLEYSVKDNIATLLLNRPEKKNAFTDDMLTQWRQCLLDAEDDGNVRVIVVRGAGDAFCSGGDLGRRTREPQAGEPTTLQRKQRFRKTTHAVALTLPEIDKPVIAAVNGAAVGAGMDMALMCDIRLAARSARFSEGYVRVGLIPGNGGCYFLPRIVGVARALELLMTGEFIGSEEALRIGLVNHVYDDDKFIESVYAYARKLAAMPPVAVSMIKRTVYQSLSCDLRTSLELISSHMAIVQTTEDYREAIAAYKGKRTGAYKGK
jgi:2-(1,2-epoxy-1,2-dihydrophenyl)acetyl-CoA isomerase